MKYFKKIFIMIMLVAMCSHSFAAIISDNDGSAFVTKAEFDALKNNFNKQIDDYNASIDGKIDGAIASYLAGIQVSKSTPYSNVSGFDKYYFINKTLKPTFIVPSWHAIINHGGDANYAAEDTKSFHVNSESKYTQPDNSECKRPLFGVITGSEKTGVTDLYWRGVALAYSEKFEVAQARYFHASNLQFTNGYQYRARFEGLHAIIAPDGYIADLSVDTVFAPVMWQQWKNGSNPWQDNTSAGDISSSYKNNYLYVQTLVSLGTIDNKQTEYDHIGCYKGDTEFTLSNETFLHTLRTHSKNTLKDSDVRNVVSADVYGGFVGSVSGAGSRTELTSVVYTDKNIVLKSIGMLKDDVAAKNIKQFSSSFNYSAKNPVSVPNSTLKDGLIFAYGEEGNTIDWDVDISKVTINNGSTDVVNSNEVDIYVSYVPFSDTVSSTDLVKLTTSTDYMTTTSRKAHLKWTANKSSLFYVKMVPHFTGTSYIDNSWEIELNLDGNYGEYILTAET